MLYESINAISNAKYLEDKFQLEIDRQATLISTIQEEKVDLDERLKVVFKERDDFRDMVREMVDVKARADREKVQFTMMTKATIHKHEQSIKKLTSDLDKKLDETLKLDQENKVLKAEREKMKQRIIKLKSRKGKVDQGIKMCKLCAQEFHEKENFNWSCRSH